MIYLKSSMKLPVGRGGGGGGGGGISFQDLVMGDLIERGGY